MDGWRADASPSDSADHGNSSRATDHGQWTKEVKAKIPELLAGIFALYAILRSGKAYSSVLASATSDPDDKGTGGVFIILKYNIKN